MSGIRIRDPSIRAASDSHRTRHNHWDRHLSITGNVIPLKIMPPRLFFLSFLFPAILIDLLHFLLLLLINCKWVCTLWQCYYSNTQHSKLYTTHKITNTIKHVSYIKNTR